MKKTGIVAVVAAASLALAACSGDSGKKGGDAASSGSPAASGSSSESKIKAADYLHAKYDELKDGGTLTTAIVEIPEQLNSFHQDSNAYTSTLWTWYAPQLSLYEDDGTWKFNPDYFDDVKAEEKDGKTVVTYKIKKEATFNDGTPIDVNAFRVTWEDNNGTNPAFKPNSTDGYSEIESVKAGANDKEVIVTFKGPYAWWMGLFGTVLHPKINTPELYNNAYLNDQAHPEYGAGPYKLVKIDRNANEVVFERNEKWWGPKGKLDKRVFRVLDSQASLNSFLAGEIDATGAATNERYTAVKKMADISIYKSTVASNSLLMLNSASPVLKDIKVRQAIFEGIDRKVLADIRFKGLDYTEEAPGSFLLFPYQPGYEDNFSKAVKFDPDAAKKLLDEEGWKAGADGIREKDGQKLTINYPLLGDSPSAKAQATAIQQMLKSIGVDVAVKERPSSDFSKVINERDFDIFALGFRSTDPYGVAYTNQIYGSDSGLNRSGTGTKEIDAELEKLAKIPDPKEQIKFANQIETEAFKTYGIMPLFNGPDISAVKKGLANYGSMGFAVIPVENIGWVK